MLCYCCYKDKDRKEFGTHRVSKSLPQFCIECYHAYTHKERKEKQIKYIFDIMIKITNKDLA